MKNKLKKILFFITLLILGSVQNNIAHAEGPVKFYLDPSNGDIYSGAEQERVIDFRMDPQGYQTNGAEIQFQYQPSFITITGIDPNNDLGVTVTPFGDSYDGGRHYMFTFPGNIITQNSILGRVHFKANVATASNIDVRLAGAKASLVGAGVLDITNGVTVAQAKYNIIRPPSATSVPTPSPTSLPPTPSPTPTPLPTKPGLYNPAPGDSFIAPSDKTGGYNATFQWSLMGNPAGAITRNGLRVIRVPDAPTPGSDPGNMGCSSNVVLDEWWFSGDISNVPTCNSAPEKQVHEINSGEPFRTAYTTVSGLAPGKYFVAVLNYDSTGYHCSLNCNGANSSTGDPLGRFTTTQYFTVSCPGAAPNWDSANKICVGNATPTPTPPSTTAFYRISETKFKKGDDSPFWQPYTNDEGVNPVVVPFTFKNAKAGNDMTVFVQFKSSREELSPVISKSIRYIGGDPSISSVSCTFDPSGRGTLVTIAGVNFGAHDDQQGTGNVKVEGQDAQIISWSDNVSVPENTPTPGGSGGLGDNLSSTPTATPSAVATIVPTDTLAPTSVPSSTPTAVPDTPAPTSTSTPTNSPTLTPVPQVASVTFNGQTLDLTGGTILSARLDSGSGNTYDLPVIITYSAGGSEPRNLIIRFNYQAPTPTPTLIPTNTPAPTSTPTPSIRRVFVTSTTYNGNLEGLSGADAKCQTRADAASLGGIWKAWLSDSKTSAASRLEHAAVPYKLLNGTTVANNWVDLTDGTLQSPININELNRIVAQPGANGFLVRTGTRENGDKMDPSWDSNYYCGNFSSNASSYTSMTGSLTSAITWWTTSGNNQSCTVSLPLYCFEQGSSLSADAGVVLGTSARGLVSALVPEKLEGSKRIELTLDDGRVATGRCTVNATTVSFNTKTQCRSGGNFSVNNATVKIYEVAKGANAPLYTQTINIDSSGIPQSFAPRLEVNKKYALVIKAPKGVAVKKEFTALAGTTNLDDIGLPVGDIAPLSAPDGTINSLDKAELMREWTTVTDVTRAGDFNIDSRVNSLDYSCMRDNFNKGDDTFTAPVN